MSALPGRHKGGERVRDSILRLMENGRHPFDSRQPRLRGNQAWRVLHSTTTDDDAPGAEVVYSFSRTMKWVIANSHY